MAKRIYAETVKKWAKVGGVSVTSFIGLLFVYLSFLGAIEITGFSGDQVCAGTELDPCYAYINLTAKEDIFIYPTGYDPWGRNTFMEFSPGVKDWKLQRSWGKGWRNIPLNKTCTGTWCGAPNNLGVAYSYVLREGRDYQLRIVAYKNNPSDLIKWAVNYEDKEYLDPVWLPLVNYTIEGNKVYFEDSRAYIEVYPHTASNREWVTFNFTSKLFSGDVDIILGFDKSEMFPSGVRKYNPTNETRQGSYTCTESFNYTLDPNYATCYYNYYDTDNETLLEVINIFEHEFDIIDIEGKSLYWNEEYVDEYKNVSSSVFNSLNYNYQGIDKWFYYKNLPVIQGEPNAFQVQINSINPWGTESKYWFAIKPSSLTIQQAINQDKFYSIDPWTEGLSDGLVSYWALNDNDLTDGDGLSGNDMTNFGTTNTTGIIGSARDSGNNIGYLSNSSILTGIPRGNEDRETCLWVDYTDRYVGNSFLFGYGEPHVTVRDEWGIYLLEGGKVRGTIYGYDIDYTSISTGWHYICFSHDGTTQRLYIDDIFRGSMTHTLITAGGDLEIASIARSSAENGRDIVDEVAIWNRTLTSPERTALYNSGDGLTYVPPTPSDTCTYTSGDWNINCFDNCTIESNVNLGTNDMVFNRTGTFKIAANITGYASLNLSSGCDIILNSGVNLISI